MKKAVIILEIILATSVLPFSQRTVNIPANIFNFQRYNPWKILELKKTPLLHENEQEKKPYIIEELPIYV